MSARTAFAYVVGAVVGIATAFFIGPAGFGLASATTAAIIGGLAFSTTASLIAAGGQRGAGQAAGFGAQQSLGKQSAGTVKSAASAELEVASASEAVTIPVIFGTVKLPGNHIRFSASTFRTVPIIKTIETEAPTIITQTGGGGGSTSGGGGKGFGGGGDTEQPTSKTTQSQTGKKSTIKQVVGYDYYLSWDYGLCMGPIDRLHRIYDGTNQRVMSNTQTAFSTHSLVRNIAGGGTDGRVRIFRGSDAQTRISTEPYFNMFSNYRHVAFAAFQDFHMGQQASPRTYLFEVQRMPVCRGTDGNPVTGLKTRGSADTNHECYLDANPAAVLWEILTNRVWGRGLPPGQLDADSFIEASEYFESRNFGISITIEAQDVVSTVMEQIRQHCNAAIVWTGSRLRCIILSNTTATNSVPKATLWADQVKEVQFSRPAWPDITNELRVEFTNRANNYKPELAHVQDDAAINVAGVINSQKLMLPGISNRKTAEQEAQRILSEVSTPKGSLNFKMNRWDSHLEPGDLIRFVWNEWGDTVTGFYRIAEIKEAEDIQEGIEVSAVEDIYNAPYFGEPEGFTAPTPPFLGYDGNENSDLYLDDDKNEPEPVGSIAPVRLIEPPIFMSGATGVFALTAERPQIDAVGANLYWSLAGVEDFKLHATFTTPWAVNAELTSNIPLTRRSLCRFTSDAFTFTLETPTLDAAILSSANKVQLDTDDLQVLTSGADVLIIGREIILVGLVEELSLGVYTATNYIRGAFGSYREAHTSGKPLVYLSNTELELFMTTIGTMPVGQALDLQAVPFTLSGDEEEATEATATLEGLSLMPYCPGFLSASLTGATWTIRIRPRWHANGALVEPDLYTELNTLQQNKVPLYVYNVAFFTGAVENHRAVNISGPFIDDDGTTPETGVMSLVTTIPVAGTTHIRIRTNYKGVLSRDYIEVDVSSTPPPTPTPTPPPTPTAPPPTPPLPTPPPPTPPPPTPPPPTLTPPPPTPPPPTPPPPTPPPPTP